MATQLSKKPSGKGRVVLIPWSIFFSIFFVLRIDPIYIYMKQVDEIKVGWVTRESTRKIGKSKISLDYA